MLSHSVVVKPEEKHLLLNISWLILTDWLSDSVTVWFWCWCAWHPVQHPEILEHSHILYMRRNILYWPVTAQRERVILTRYACVNILSKETKNKSSKALQSSLTLYSHRKLKARIFKVHHVLYIFQGIRSVLIYFTGVFNDQRMSVNNNICRCFDSWS